MNLTGNRFTAHTLLFISAFKCRKYCENKTDSVSVTLEENGFIQQRPTETKSKSLPNSPNFWRLCKSIRIVMCRHCSKQIGLLHWWQITILADQFKGKKSRKVALKTVFMHATVIGLVFFHFLDLTHNFSYFQFKSH